MFGEVLEGYEHVKYIENVAKGGGDGPKENVTIAKSGEIQDEVDGTEEPAASPAGPDAIKEEL